MQQQGGNNTECKALGTVTLDKLPDLLELLKGLSGDLRGDEVKLHEVVLRVPSSTTEVRLRHSLLPHKSGTPSQQDRWVARHQVTNMRGNIRELPAMVQTVIEAKCQGPDVLGFWKGLSLQQAYESVRDGMQYKVRAGEHIVQVEVMSMYKLTREGDVSSALELAPEQRLVEATCKVPNGAHVAGAKSIGELAAMLKPLVELKKG